MTDVDKIALWVGLIGSVAGIVLSIVAIVLSIVSNNRATAVNDQTIKSLQKIESAVERLSDDSRTLIKAGWDKMLGNFNQRSDPGPDSCEVEETNQAPIEIAPMPVDAKTTAAGSTEAKPTEDDGFSKLERQIESLRQSIARQSRGSDNIQSPTRTVDRLTSILTSLSPRAQALFDVISRSRHLTEEQFEALERSEIGLEARELRQTGLIVSLVGHGPDEKSRVYWLPSGFARAARVASQLAPRISSELIESVKSDLRKIGYAPR